VSKPSISLKKTGKLIAIKSVTDNDDLMIINKSGILIRISVADLRVMGRATQGVKLINLKDNDVIAAVAKVGHDLEGDDEETEIEGGDNTPDGQPTNEGSDSPSDEGSDSPSDEGSDSPSNEGSDSPSNEGSDSPSDDVDAAPSNENEGPPKEE